MKLEPSSRLLMACWPFAALAMFGSMHWPGTPRRGPAEAVVVACTVVVVLKVSVVRVLVVDVMVVV